MPVTRTEMSANHQPLTKVPKHVAVIMDGNGRWANRRALPRLAGHRAGTENIRQIVESCVEFGVENLTVFAFSTENWERPRDEVSGLLRIMGEVITRELENLNRNGVRLRHVGRADGVPARLMKQIEHAVEYTRDNTRLNLNVAFNYGGRAEIVDSVRNLIRSGIDPADVDEAAIERNLYTAGLPDPDLIIRTAGEMRLSNFLLWQAAYAEYYSTPVFWPDFDKNALYEALLEYQRRDRRFGRLPSPG